MTYLAIVAALEALGAGDYGLVEAILLGALEDEPRGHGTMPRPAPCPVCGMGFTTAGLLDHHLRFSHGQDAA